MNKLVSLACAALFALALPFAASADAAEDLAAKKEKWVNAYQELQYRHAQLKTNLEQARIDYSRGRSTQHLRGEGKAGLLKEIQRLEEEFAAADQELQDFPDKARRDGAFPGWFRDLEPPDVTAVPAAAATPAAPASASEQAGAGDDDDDSTSRAEERAAKRKSRRLGD